MTRPHRAVFVLPLRPRKLLLPAVLLAGLAVLLITSKNSTAARYSPEQGDPPAELRLLPPDTFAVIHVNVQGLLNTDLARTTLRLLYTAEGKDLATAGAGEFGVPFSYIEGLAFL